MDAKLKAAVDWLQGRLPEPPAVWVILGSGLGDFAGQTTDALTIPYTAIPGFPPATILFWGEHINSSRCLVWAFLRNSP